MAITWAQVVLIAPELSTVATATQNLLLVIVDRQIDGEVWGSYADDGALYLAAHLGTLANGGAAGAGPVTSETLGPMSRSYGMPSGVSGTFGTTRYGVMFEQLRLIAVGIAAFVP